MIFRVAMEFIIQSVCFWKIYDEIILQYTSEACIWFLTATFIMIIIRVAWVEGWFIISLFLSRLLKSFLSWV